MRIEDAANDYGLARAPAAVLCRLAESSGRIVPTQALRDALDAATGSRATDEALRSAIKRARRGLAGRATIIATRGIGWRLDWA